MSLTDWQQIDTVLLDMDGTLLDLHFDNYFWLDHLPAVYAQQHGLSEEEALAELNKSFIGLRGTLDWYCLDYWTELTGLPIAELKRDVQHKIGFRPHVQDFLARLKQLGKRTVIVTNGASRSMRSPSCGSSRETTPVVGAITVISPALGTSCPVTCERRVYWPNRRKASTTAAASAHDNASSHKRNGCASEIPPSHWLACAASASLRNRDSLMAQADAGAVLPTLCTAWRCAGALCAAAPCS